MSATRKPTEPTPDNEDWKIDPFRPPQIDINKRYDSIIESDDTVMQAPEPWPDPPKDEDAAT